MLRDAVKDIQARVECDASPKAPSVLYVSIRPLADDGGAVCRSLELTGAQAFSLPGLPVCTGLLLFLGCVPIWAQQLRQQAYSL